MEKNMFENKTNFYYPGSGAVAPTPGVPAGETVEQTETTPTTPTATKKIKPKTREEHYLAKIAGEDVTIPEPKTRQEHYLKEIAENGGGGGGALEFVEFSYDGETATCNKTFSEIASMTLPIGILNGQGLSVLAQRSGLLGKKVFYGACVLDRIGVNPGKFFVEFNITEDGSVNADEKDLTNL